MSNLSKKKTQALIDNGTITFKPFYGCGGMEIHIKGARHRIFVHKSEARDYDATVDGVTSLVFNKLVQNSWRQELMDVLS